MPSMDIALNRPLEYEALNGFLRRWLPNGRFFLLYEGINDWENVPKEQLIIQYSVNEAQPGPFKYGLSVFADQAEPLLFIERLAQAVSQMFQCSTLCDATRVLLKANKTYYSLLFEAGQVYLVNDFDFEESGELTKIVSLNYVLPTETNDNVQFGS
ncbi:hypothetical protein [Candidatus Leptofilum sp.]|uniref:hypothetical protein n=1 Tax=Candidatus Leptofilum sp. TaxID=3241576 RepID=UPI003B5B45FF